MTSKTLKHLAVGLALFSMGCRVPRSPQSGYLFAMNTSEWSSFRDGQLKRAVREVAQAVSQSGHVTVAVLPCTGKNSFTMPADRAIYGGATREQALQSLRHTADMFFRKNWHNYFVTGLSQFAVVTRTPEELQAILVEIDLSSTDIIDSQSAVKAGRLLGARVVIIPSVDAVQIVTVVGGETNQYVDMTYNVLLLEVETGRVLLLKTCSDRNYRRMRPVSEYAGEKWEW